MLLHFLQSIERLVRFRLALLVALAIARELVLNGGDGKLHFLAAFRSDGAGLERGELAGERGGEEWSRGEGEEGEDCGLELHGVFDFFSRAADSGVGRGEVLLRWEKKTRIVLL